MEDRRLSKRKTKRPSYLQNFHTEDSKEAKHFEGGLRSIERRRNSGKAMKGVKIKPRSSVKTK